MTNEKRQALLIVLASLWLGFMCGYGVITVGHFWIFTMGFAVAAIMLIVGVFNVISEWGDED